MNGRGRIGYYKIAEGLQNDTRVVGIIPPVTNHMGPGTYRRIDFMYVKLVTILLMCIPVPGPVYRSTGGVDIPVVPGIRPSM
jgi:hypothetical protein